MKNDCFYVLTQTGEKVEFGDVIQKIENITTSFGEMKSITEITLTPNNIQKLIIEGIIECKTVNKEVTEEVTDDAALLYQIFVSLAKDYGIPSDEMAKLLDILNAHCEKAVLDILLAKIAEIFKEKDEDAFAKADTYYTLSSIDGTIRKIRNPLYVNKHNPAFKSEEEAKLARKVLKGQLEIMYGKQEDN